jgi:HSP20 family protein
MNRQIARWNPIREMAAMQNAMDRLFDETWRSTRPGYSGSTLALDMTDNGDSYSITADIPGVQADNINVNVHDGVLTISAELQEPQFEEDVRVLLQERPYGQFARSINLPQPVDTEKIDATYEEGVLTLTIPKVPEVQPRTITVKAGRKK